MNNKKYLIDYLDAKHALGKAMYDLDEKNKKLDNFISDMKRRMFLEAQTGKTEGVNNASKCGGILEELLLDIGLSELEVRSRLLVVNNIELEARLENI